MVSLTTVDAQLESSRHSTRFHQTQLFGEALLKAILLEVCCYPKPGLVTPHSSGAHSDMNLQTFILSSAAMCAGLCQRDFAALQQRPPLTAGESLYHTYGVTGIRGEAEKGFPTVIEFGLPALTAAFAQGADIRTAMSHCLIVIIANCEDTTVLWRGGPQLLKHLRLRARAIVDAGGMLTQEGEQQMQSLHEWCCQERISPGGCADLLAVTVGIYLICHQHFPNGVM